jgi:hypothetical protein
MEGVMKVTDSVGLVSYLDWCKKLYASHGVKTLIDLGAGTNPQKKLCESLRIRQLLIDLGYSESLEPGVVRKQIDVMDFQSIGSAIHEFTDGDTKVDCVVSIQNIEHLSKKDGFILLNAVEKFARYLVVFETPNGFVHQAATQENPFQEHKSGWNVNDFKKLGYTVRGTTGLKVLKKNRDKGAYCLNIRGMKLLDVVISRVLFVHYFPKLCFNIIAYKRV